MALEDDCLYQKAVLWPAKADTFDDYGEPEVELLKKEEVSVRWEETQSQALDPQGNPIAIDAVAVVDRDIVPGSVMWLGSLASLPATITNLKEVKLFSKVPDIKGRNFRRTVSLVKYSDELPGGA